MLPCGPDKCTAPTVCPPPRPLPLVQWPNFVVLIGWAVFYRLAFFLTLKLKERKSK